MQLVLAVPFVDGTSFAAPAFKLRHIEPLWPCTAGVTVDQRSWRLEELNATLDQAIVLALYQDPGQLADTGEHNVRYEWDAVGSPVCRLNPVLMGEHADGQTVRTHGLQFVVQAVMRVRGADEQLAAAWHQNVRLLAQTIPQLFPRLGRLNIARHLNVIVLALVGPGGSDVRQDALGEHRGVPEVSSTLNPPLFNRALVWR